MSNTTEEKARTVLQEQIQRMPAMIEAAGGPDTEAGVRVYVMGMLAMARKLDLLTVEEYMDLLAQIG